MEKYMSMLNLIEDTFGPMEHYESFWDFITRNKTELILLFGVAIPILIAHILWYIHVQKEPDKKDKKNKKK